MSLDTSWVMKSTKPLTVFFKSRKFALFILKELIKYLVDLSGRVQFGKKCYYIKIILVGLPLEVSHIKIDIKLHIFTNFSGLYMMTMNFKLHNTTTYSIHCRMLCSYSEIPMY